jgi:SAM-dependent methyltransferase
MPHFDELERAVGDSRSLLDVGCGADSPVRQFRRRILRLVGVDGFAPSIEESRRRKIHDDYACLDLLHIDQAFADRSFDCVFAADVIEHFPKADGLELIRKMERIAAARVVLFTPNGFLPQNEHSGNALQRHQSGWTVAEMTALGYDVVGINGWKPLLGEFALPRWSPAAFWTVVSRLTQPLVRSHPRHAFQILCVKQVGGRR